MSSESLSAFARVNRWGVLHLKVFRGFASQLGDALNQPKTAVVTQQRVIVSLGANLLRLFKALHSVFKAGQQAVREMPSLQLGLSTALVKNAAVIRTLVGAG